MRARKVLADQIKFTALTVQWSYTFALYSYKPETPSNPAPSASHLTDPPDSPLHLAAAG